jgi:hypothetical protein
MQNALLIAAACLLALFSTIGASLPYPILPPLFAVGATNSLNHFLGLPPKLLFGIALTIHPLGLMIGSARLGSARAAVRPLRPPARAARYRAWRRGRPRDHRAGADSPIVSAVYPCSLRHRPARGQWLGRPRHAGRPPRRRPAPARIFVAERGVLHGLAGRPPACRLYPGVGHHHAVLGGGRRANADGGAGGRGAAARGVVDSHDLVVAGGATSTR